MLIICFEVFYNDDVLVWVFREVDIKVGLVV